MIEIALGDKISGNLVSFLFNFIVCSTAMLLMSSFGTSKYDFAIFEVHSHVHELGIKRDQSQPMVKSLKEVTPWFIQTLIY